MKVTKMVDGKVIDVPIDTIWKSIVKIIYLARIATTEEEKYTVVRMAFLRERLDDLRGLTFDED